MSMFGVVRWRSLVRSSDLPDVNGPYRCRHGVEGSTMSTSVVIDDDLKDFKISTPDVDIGGHDVTVAGSVQRPPWRQRIVPLSPFGCAAWRSVGSWPRPPALAWRRWWRCSPREGTRGQPGPTMGRLSPKPGALTLAPPQLGSPFVAQ